MRSAFQFICAVCLATATVAPSALAQVGGTSVAVGPRLTFSAEEMALAEAVANDPVLAEFYGATGLRPIFTAADKGPLRDAMSASFAAAGEHGLPAKRYQIQEIGAGLRDEIGLARSLSRYLGDLTQGLITPSGADRQIHRQTQRFKVAQLMRGVVAAENPVQALRQLAPQDQAYLDLQKALKAQAQLVVPVGLPPAPLAVWRVGMSGPGIAELRARLDSIGFAAAATDPTQYDQALSDAVARYQDAVGLRADGIAGPNTIRHLNAGPGPQQRAILVALERMRWMGDQDLNARMIWVNIPEYTARIMEGGHEVFRTRVVVGKTDHDMRTPEFSDLMEYVVVNPRWNVPRSITVREYLPRLQANRNAVAHLDVVDGRGNIIPRDRIDFKRYTAANFPYRMRQKPSDDNALGLVKFIFPNPWNIYLHDTPTKHLFANSRRAYSHGCVRVGDPFDLATALLSRQSDDPSGLFHRTLATQNERWLKLDPPVPVHLVYFTAFPDQTGRIRYFDDIYGRDAAVWEKLARAGLDLDGGKD